MLLEWTCPPDAAAALCASLREARASGVLALECAAAAGGAPARLVQARAPAHARARSSARPRARRRRRPRRLPRRDRGRLVTLPAAAGGGGGGRRRRRRPAVFRAAAGVGAGRGRGRCPTARAAAARARERHGGAAARAPGSFVGPVILGAGGREPMAEAAADAGAGAAAGERSCSSRAARLGADGLVLLVASALVAAVGLATDSGRTSSGRW